MPRTKAPPKKHKTFRLSARTIRKIERLARNYGDSQAAVIAVAVDVLYREEMLNGVVPMESRE